jgi:hypothetical protein
MHLLTTKCIDYEFYSLPIGVINMNPDTWFTFTDSVPLNLSTQAIVRCMNSAARKGYNPYDSHATQALCWNRAWQDKARREAAKERAL